MSLDSPPRQKDPRFVAAGRKAMRARWGPQRVVRLDRLDPATAGVIRAILNAQDNAATREAAPTGENVGAAQGGVRRASVERSSD